MLDAERRIPNPGIFIESHTRFTFMSLVKSMVMPWKMFMNTVRILEVAFDFTSNVDKV